MGTFIKIGSICDKMSLKKKKIKRFFSIFLFPGAKDNSIFIVLSPTSGTYAYVPYVPSPTPMFLLISVRMERYLLFFPFFLLFLFLILFLVLFLFVADGINSVGDYNSPPGGCRLSVCLFVCVCPHLFFTFHDWITSKCFKLSS